MRIEVNGEVIEVSQTRLSDILVECGYRDAKIATALNGEIVHQHLRDDTRLTAGDRLEVLAPIYGG